MTVDFSHLGPCDFCEQNIVIENNHPCEQLDCGHFFHGHCITKRREETNQCPSCDSFMSIIQTGYTNRLEGGRFDPLPWKLTRAGACGDEGQREKIEKKAIALLCNHPTRFLPGRVHDGYPDIWNRRWEAAVVNLGKEKLFQVIDFYLQRGELIHDESLLDFFVWAKKNQFFSKEEEKEVIHRLLSLQQHLCGIKLVYIDELKKLSSSLESDEGWQRCVKDDWYRNGYYRWEMVAKLIINGFAAPDNMHQLFNGDEWVTQYRGSSSYVLSGDIYESNQLMVDSVKGLREVMERAGLLENSDVRVFSNEGCTIV